LIGRKERLLNNFRENPPSPTKKKTKKKRGRLGPGQMCGRSIRKKYRAKPSVPSGKGPIKRKGRKDGASNTESIKGERMIKMGGEKLQEVIRKTQLSR